MKFPKVGEFTEQELTAWLDELDIYWSAAIVEKLYKDMRDYTFAHEKEERLRQHEE